MAYLDPAMELVKDGVPGLIATVGSHAYGTDHADSDLDLRGFYIANTTALYRLQGPQQTIDRTEPDICLHELHKFARLAAAGNPNILECMWAPDRTATPLAQRVVNARDAFLSKRVADTYGGYAKSQFEKWKRGTGGSRGQKHMKREKFLMHLFRLMFQGTALLSTGNLEVRMSEGEKNLIRYWLAWIGAVPHETAVGEMTRVFDSLDKTLREAADGTDLPPEPDYPAIDDLLIDIRKEMLPQGDWDWPDDYAP